MRDRHLAWAEAVDADLVLERVQPLIELGIKLGRRDDDTEFVLEAFGERFGNLH